MSPGRVTGDGRRGVTDAGRLRGITPAHVRRLAAAALLAALAAACGDDEPSPTLVEHAAPLVDAHALLEDHAEHVEAAPEEALRDWPDVEAAVTAAVDELPDPDTLDLEARERSTLVGYTRGLEVAVGAWGDVHAARAAGDAGAAEEAADRARDRMRHLDRLREGVTP